jgi:hypothetical protein
MWLGAMAMAWCLTESCATARTASLVTSAMVGLVLAMWVSLQGGGSVGQVPCCTC